MFYSSVYRKVIIGIEGAIPIKFLADLISRYFDVRPSKKDTECLITKANLFHYTAITKNDPLADLLIKWLPSLKEQVQNSRKSEPIS